MEHVLGEKDHSRRPHTKKEKKGKGQKGVNEMLFFMFKKRCHALYLDDTQERKVVLYKLMQDVEIRIGLFHVNNFKLKGQ